MNLTYNKTKLMVGVMVFVSLYIIGANTYNSIVDHGRIEYMGVLKESLSAITTIFSSFYALTVHKVDTNGDKL